MAYIPESHKKYNLLPSLDREGYLSQFGSIGPYGRVVVMEVLYITRCALYGEKDIEALALLQNLCHLMHSIGHNDVAIKWNNELVRLRKMFMVLTTKILK